MDGSISPHPKDSVSESADRKFRKELSAGITSLSLLSILSSSDKPMYGYQIAKLMEDDEADAPLIKHGALYPVLRSLEGNGLLSSMVEPSVSGPPRRYYSITPAGRDALGRWIDIWSNTGFAA
jgi:PadR family transcriptional regulator PadR